MVLEYVNQSENKKKIIMTLRDLISINLKLQLEIVFSFFLYGKRLLILYVWIGLLTLNI